MATKMDVSSSPSSSSPPPVAAALTDGAIIATAVPPKISPEKQAVLAAKGALDAALKKRRAACDHMIAAKAAMKAASTEIKSVFADIQAARATLKEARENNIQARFARQQARQARQALRQQRKQQQQQKKKKAGQEVSVNDASPANPTNAATNIASAVNEDCRQRLVCTLSPGALAAAAAMTFPTTADTSAAAEAADFVLVDAAEADMNETTTTTTTAPLTTDTNEVSIAPTAQATSSGTTGGEVNQPLVDGGALSNSPPLLTPESSSTRNPQRRRRVKISSPPVKAIMSPHSGRRPQLGRHRRMHINEEALETARAQPTLWPGHIVVLCARASKKSLRIMPDGTVNGLGGYGPLARFRVVARKGDCVQLQLARIANAAAAAAAGRRKNIPNDINNDPKTKTTTTSAAAQTKGFLCLGEDGTVTSGTSDSHTSWLRVIVHHKPDDDAVAHQKKKTKQGKAKKIDGAEKPTVTGVAAATEAATDTVEGKSSPPCVSLRHWNKAIKAGVGILPDGSTKTGTKTGMGLHGRFDVHIVNTWPLPQENAIAIA